MNTSYPRLLINEKKIEENVKKLISLCNKYGIQISGVTKATLGDPKIALSMLRGGVTHIADSRIQNIQRMIQAKVPGPFILLRSPMLSEVEEVVKMADISLNSEIHVIKALGARSLKQNKTHNIIIMVEMGDLREGVMPKDLKTFISTVKKIQGVNILGLGMNLTCYGAIIPTTEKIQEFCAVVKEMEKEFGEFKIISGGNSSTIPLLLQNSFKNPCITDLRFGESILLGLETVTRKLIDGLYPDAFILEAEIIELKTKPSIPYGVIGEDAFGNKPVFKNQGNIQHALAAIGHQDIGEINIEPVDPNIEILGCSSDHLVLNIKSNAYQVGSIIQFNLKYGSLLHAYTSPFVSKCYL